MLYLSVFFAIFTAGFTVCNSHDHCDTIIQTGITWKEKCAEQLKDCDDSGDEPICVNYTSCEAIYPGHETTTFHEYCPTDNNQICVDFESNAHCAPTCNSVDSKINDTWWEKCNLEGKECQDTEQGAECIFTCRAPSTKKTGMSWEQYCREMGKECDPILLPAALCRETCRTASTEDPSKTWKKYCEDKGEVCEESSLLFARCKETCNSPFITLSDGTIITWASHCDDGENVCKENSLGPECVDKNTPCVFNNCENGGTCEVIEFSEKCVCPPHYSGKKCEKYAACTVSGLTCGSNAKCQDMDNTAVCVCNDNAKVYDYKKNDCVVVFFAAVCELTGCTEKGEICDTGLCKCNDKKYYKLGNGSCMEKECEFPNLNDCQQICKNHKTTNKAMCSCEDGFTLNTDNSCSVNEESKCEKDDCIYGDCANDVCVCRKGFALGASGVCGELDCSLCQSKKCSKMLFNYPVISICTCGVGKLLEDGASCTDPCLSEVSRKQCRKEGGMCVVNWNTPRGFHCEDPCILIRDKCQQKMQICSVDSDGNPQCVCPPGLTTTQDGCKFEKGYSEEVYIANLRFRLHQSTSSPSLLANIETQLQNALLVAYGKDIFNRVQVFDTDCFRVGDLDHSCKVALYFNKEVKAEVGRLEWHCEDRKLTDELEDYCLFGTVLFHQDSFLTGGFHKFSIEEVCPNNTRLTEGLHGPKCVCEDGYYRIGSTSIPGLDVEFCKEPLGCKNPLCGINETCVFENKELVCRCIEGYEKNENSRGKCLPWCSFSQCEKGTCEKVEGRMQCSCHDGWKGMFCNEEIPNQNTTVLVLGIVLGVVSLLAVIFGGIMLKLCVSARNSS